MIEAMGGEGGGAWVVGGVGVGVGGQKDHFLLSQSKTSGGMPHTPRLALSSVIHRFARAAAAERRKKVLVLGPNSSGTQHVQRRCFLEGQVSVSRFHLRVCQAVSHRPNG